MNKKLELTAVGYLFCLANIYMSLNGNTLAGIAFGIISGIFFIKALMIKNND